MTPCFTLAFTGLISVQLVVERTTETMSCGCTINPRKKRPNTYQLIQNPQLNSS
jgi:hypothetical protein